MIGRGAKIFMVRISNRTGELTNVRVDIVTMSEKYRLIQSGSPLV